jgi:hypothetical protein
MFDSEAGVELRAHLGQESIGGGRGSQRQVRGERGFGRTHGPDMPIMDIAHRRERAQIGRDRPLVNALRACGGEPLVDLREQRLALEWPTARPPAAAPVIAGPHWPDALGANPRRRYAPGPPARG